MGCRPSKQATSKVRAVEYKDGPQCLCSPRKHRKNHKCSSGSNSSRRNSGGSAKGSNKLSFSSSHRPRSSKSTDVDFPAFSTTTAVYRTSASKTSKITLRLSCDGSTLEIEQCDYDLEKVRGDCQFKPRPWNSAPNLSKMKEGKSRVLRDSYLPIKHSASGWSPSVNSATSGSRGGLIRVPIQVNTPDDSLSDNPSSSISPCVISYRDKGSTCPALETATFSAKTFGKTSMSRSQTSSAFSSSDERRPLLLDILKESHKKASMEGNINKAASPVLVEVEDKKTVPTNNSLDNMISQLECSLGLTYPGTSSGIKTEHAPSLRVKVNNSQEGLNSKGSEVCCTRYLVPTCASETYISSQCSDLEEIPVKVISSFITCQGHEVFSTQSGNSRCLHVPVTSIDYFHDQTQATNMVSSCDTLQHASSIDNSRPAAPTQLLTNDIDQYLKHVQINNILQQDTSRHKLSQHVCNRADSCGHTHNKLQDSFSHFSLHPAIPIDHDSVLALDKQASNDNTIYLLSTTDKSSVSLVTAESGLYCLSERGHMVQPHVGNTTNMKCATNHVGPRNCPVNKHIDKSIQSLTCTNVPVSRNKGRLMVTSTRPDNHDTVPDLAQGAENSCQLLESIACTSHGHVIRSHTVPPPLMDEIDGIVQNHHTSLQENKQQADERLGCNDRNVVSIFSRNNVHVMQPTTRTKIMAEHYASDGEIEAIADRDGDTECVMEWVEGCNTGCRAKWADVHNESFRRNLNFDGNISQPTCFSHQFHDTTAMSQQIDDNHWIVVDLADNNETMNMTSLDENQTGMDSCNHWKMSDDTCGKHEYDTFNQDAGYLVSLLCPDRDLLVSSLSSGSRFSFDMEYSECSSTSCASDNEVSPLCYSLLGQQDNYIAEQAGTDLQLDNTNTEPMLTSMHSIRDSIVCQRLAIVESELDHCCSDTQHCTNLQLKRNIGSCRHIHETCLMSLPEHEPEGDVVRLAELSHFRDVTNLIKQASNVIHRNAPDNRIDNEQANKHNLMLLDGICVQTSQASSKSVSEDKLPENVDINMEICHDNEHSVCGCVNTGSMYGCVNTGSLCGCANTGSMCGCVNTRSLCGCVNTESLCGCANEESLYGCVNTGSLCGCANTGSLCGCTNTESLYGCANMESLCGCANMESLCGCANNDSKSYSSLRRFTDDNALSSDSVLGISDLHDILASQEVKVDDLDGRVLIEELSSCRWHTRKSAERRQTGQTIIDPLDKNQLNVDETLARAINSHYVLSSYQEKTLEAPISQQNSNNHQDINRTSSKRNNISINPDADRPENDCFSLCRFAGSTNCSGQFCDTSCRLGSRSSEEITEADIINVSLTSCPRSRDLLSSNNKHACNCSLYSSNEPIPNSAGDSSTCCLPNIDSCFRSGYTAKTASNHSKCMGAACLSGEGQRIVELPIRLMPHLQTVTLRDSTSEFIEPADNLLTNPRNKTFIQNNSKQHNISEASRKAMTCRRKRNKCNCCERNISTTSEMANNKQTDIQYSYRKQSQLSETTHQEHPSGQRPVLESMPSNADTKHSAVLDNSLGPKSQICDDRNKCPVRFNNDSSQSCDVMNTPTNNVNKYITLEMANISQDGADKKMLVNCNQRAAADGSCNQRATAEGSCNQRAATEGSCNQSATADGSCNQRTATEGSCNQSATDGSCNNRAATEGSCNQRAATEGSSNPNPTERSNSQNPNARHINESSSEAPRHVPRNNVLSLVRYFEKVPYTRHGNQK